MFSVPIEDTKQRNCLKERRTGGFRLSFGKHSLRMSLCNGNNVTKYKQLPRRVLQSASQGVGVVGLALGLQPQLAVSLSSCRG